MKPWSTSEIRYLEQHAHEGVKAIAFALGRSSKAVESQASRIRAFTPSSLAVPTVRDADAQATFRAYGLVQRMHQARA